MSRRAAVISEPDIAIESPLDHEAQPLFEAAFREHYTPLVQYLRRRIGCESEARDLAQDAYVRLLRYRENQNLESLKALLFRIATNLMGMRSRRARARRWNEHQPMDEELIVAADSPSQEQQLGDQQQLDRLMAAIQRLPNKCRQVFVLSRFHDMAYPEIATRCGISVKMVEKHITKALAICRAEVGDSRS
ncbi:RNA polymerase sigma factor [Steroidobacter flavus]|uniref:RNA polymerase sigma factor n=1 Tax=Steroidobacter flavus TaxID=1842136 RepID=A0ABV8T1B6_9GAMM